MKDKSNASISKLNRLKLLHQTKLMTNLKFKISLIGRSSLRRWSRKNQMDSKDKRKHKRSLKESKMRIWISRNLIRNSLSKSRMTSKKITFFLKVMYLKKIKIMKIQPIKLHSEFTVFEFSFQIIYSFNLGINL